MENYIEYTLQLEGFHGQRQLRIRGRNPRLAFFSDSTLEYVAIDVEMADIIASYKQNLCTDCTCGGYYHPDLLSTDENPDGTYTYLIHAELISDAEYTRLAVLAGRRDHEDE